MSDLEHAQGKFYLHCLDELSKEVGGKKDLIHIHITIKHLENER